MAALNVEQGLVNNLLRRIKQRRPIKDAVQDMSCCHRLGEAAKVGDIVERTGTTESQVLLNCQFVIESFVGKQDKKLLICMRHRKNRRQSR